MVVLARGRNWFGSLRLALALLGLRLSAGLRPAAVCPSRDPLRTPNRRSFSLTPCSFRTTRGDSMAPAHIKSRCPVYPGSTTRRWPVSDAQVDWSHSWPQYQPETFTHPSAVDKPWSDPDAGASLKFNAVDGAVDRTSFEGTYRVEEGRPLNPRGRTGLAGRGLLGRWGPNHAADPIVTRWKRDASGAKVLHLQSLKPVLQFVSIKRKDCGEWAVPGGMVDPGEQVSVTLQREFSEEALNSLERSPADKEQISARIRTLFKSSGFQVYRGYVDDPRNTDNSWMETVAVNFHDEQGNSVSELPLQAGDDAGQVQWVDVDSSFPLYASHSHFLELVVREREAHW